MMSNPRRGARCRLHYAAKWWPVAPHHGRTGAVEIVARGRPRNHGVRLDGCGTLVVVPAGNLMPAGSTEPAVSGPSLFDAVE